VLRPELALLTRPGSAAHGRANATARALAFLASAVDDRGAWSDFNTLFGASTDWVTAFVACAVHGATGGRDVAPRALSALLDGQRANGGWGFNQRVPSDADSTAWALLALARAGRLQAGHAAGRDYLLRHQDAATGGFATYAAEDGIAAAIGLAAPGWSQPHPCVTAVALQALLAVGAQREDEPVVRAARYLLRAQGPTGLWEGYWWSGCGYATYQALQALAVAHRSPDDRGTRTLMERQRTDGSWSDPLAHDSPGVFETAFSMLALRHGANLGARAAIERATSWLVDAQARDGGWASTPMLMIPAPTARRRRLSATWRPGGLGSGVIVADQHRLFTSAAALMAISTCHD
jgi:squalene-hopene/tetraprenyl-beta-curcumene cyclase